MKPHHSQPREGTDNTDGLDVGLRAAFAAEPPAGSPSTCQKLGRYQVLGELGRGGLGIVLRGSDPAMGREVALKVLHERHAGNEAMARRLLEEARIGGQLQHPGIVPVYDLGQDEAGRPFFAMKRVAGETLAALLRSRPVGGADQPRLLVVFQQVCQTVAYAHACGVIHRDLKPANVMVGAFGEVQVVDWGLAKRWPASEPAAHAEVDPLKSQTGMVLGTWAYMPPEQALGEIQRVDAHSDVFGLGAILCEILTGQPPYTGATPDEVQGKAKQGDLAEALGRLRSSSVDLELVTLATRCLAREPADRPADGGVVAAAVGDHLSATEARARRAELAATEARAVAAEDHARAVEAEARAGHERLRRRRAVVLLACLMVLLGSGAGAWSWLGAERRARIARTEQGLASALERLTAARASAQAMPAGAAHGKWAEAMGILSEARALVAAGEPGAPTAARLQWIGQETEREADAARVRAERADADLRMVLRLEEIRSTEEWEDPNANKRTAYARAFRDYGIDLEAQAPEAAAAGIRATTIAPELAAAVDDWADAWRGRLKDDPTARENRKALLAVSRQADPDAWRNLLRDAWDVASLEEARMLGTAPEVETATPETLRLLSHVMIGAGDLDGAERIFALACRHHAGSFWTHFEFTHFLRRFRPAKTDLIIRHTVAGLAIRPDSVHLWTDLAAVHNDQGDLDAALEALNQGIRRDPSFATAHRLRSDVLRRRGRLDDAVAACREAMRLRPEDAEYWLELGILLREARDLQGSLEALRQSASRGPTSYHLEANLGITLKLQGDVEAAVGHLRRAAALDPAQPVPHSNLASILLDRGDDQGATAALREAVRLGERNPMAHSNLGFLLARSGDLTGALAAVRAGLAIDPQHEHCLGNEALFLLDGGEREAALQAAERALALRPKSALLLAVRGEILARLGRVTEAVEVLRSSLELNAGSFAAHFTLGKLLASEQQDAEALVELRTACRLDPGHAEARELLAWVLERLRSFDEAIAEFREAIRLDPRRLEAQCHLGRLLVRHGEIDEGIAALRLAVAIDRQHREAWLGLAKALQRKGRVDGAVRAFREVVRIAPEAAVHYDLGRLLAQGRHLVDAVEQFQAALELDPKHARAEVDLGAVRILQGRTDLALKAFRRGAQLAPDLQEAWLNLGNALRSTPDHAGAEHALRQALRLAPGDAATQAQFGFALLRRGRPSEALEHLQGGHEHGRALPEWRLPSARWLEQAVADADLEARLRDYTQGRAEPQAGAHARLARLCEGRGEDAFALRFYRVALSQAPDPDPPAGDWHRFRAACVAARTGEWRDSLKWLREELAWLSDPGGCPEGLARAVLALWREEPDLASTRGQAATGADRAQWEALWSEVDRLLADGPKVR